MDTHAQQDSAGFAFEKPFQPQGNGPLRPFSAVDLAPRARPGTPGPLGPTVSPFLESFAAPADAGSEEMPAAPAASPMAEWTAAATPLPATPMAPIPAAARSSRILAAPDLPGPGAPVSKPSFFLTSTAAVDGCSIQAYLGVLSAEVVLPKDLLFRNPAPYGELHRLKAAEDQLQKLKAAALQDLSEKAKALQADGIVGVTVTFTNLDTVCCLCSAVGTAIKIA